MKNMCIIEYTNEIQVLMHEGVVICNFLGTYVHIASEVVLMGGGGRWGSIATYDFGNYYSVLLLLFFLLLS